MVSNGDSNKALWASAFGWNSLPLDWSGSPSIWGQVESSEQVRFTLEALDRADREWPWMGGMILHHWQPDAPQDDPIWGFSIIDPAGNPTPLWTALIQRLQPTSAQNGLFHPLNPYTRYSGVWTFGALGADIGWFQAVTGDTSASLLLRVAPTVAWRVVEDFWLELGVGEVMYSTSQGALTTGVSLRVAYRF